MLNFSAVRIKHTIISPLTWTLIVIVIVIVLGVNRA